MPEVVGVRFKKAGKVYYFDPSGFDLGPGDYVVVETSRGMELGEVITRRRVVPEGEIVAPLRQVIRKATNDDLERAEANQHKQREAFRICQEKIEKHGLDMKLVDVEYTFDNGKIVFYFTADGRVDFRELVRDLASALKTRIELRQIGIRDETKIMGGLGPCGRVTCCRVFLTDFEPVSIRMAKQQNLPLNPAKISGLCGRLMCCLRFECESYAEAKHGLPAAGTFVATTEGDGVVTAVDASKATVTVELEDGRVAEFPAEEVEKIPQRGETGDGG